MIKNQIVSINNNFIRTQLCSLFYEVLSITDDNGRIEWFWQIILPQSSEFADWSFTGKVCVLWWRVLAMRLTMCEEKRGWVKMGRGREALNMFGEVNASKNCISIHPDKLLKRNSKCSILFYWFLKHPYYYHLAKIVMTFPRKKLFS